jgi:hypothetical protein
MFLEKYLGAHLGPQSSAQSNFKEGFFFSSDKNKKFFGKLLRPFVGVNSDFLKF